MRIANLVPSGDYWRRISDRLADDSAARAGASVETHYVGEIGTGGISPLSIAMTDLLFINAAIGAADDGCDAIFINTVPDYGVPVLRSSLPIPVIGAGEAAIFTARSLAARFSIVTVVPSAVGPLYDRLLARTESAANCASVIWAVTEGDSPVKGASITADMEANEAWLLDRLEQSCRRAIDEDGADAIVLGCTCMHPIAESLARRVDRPVLDPVTVGWRFAEFTAQFAKRPPDTGAPREHLDGFRKILAGAADATAGTDAECEVCLIPMAAALT